MASEAYIRRSKNIPGDIRRDVKRSINTSEDIREALNQNNMRPVDLANELEKSESEISKWLSGTHNFTGRTIAKIEDKLDTSIWFTKEEVNEIVESKLKPYQKCINRLNKELDDLRAELFKLTMNSIRVELMHSLEADKHDSIHLYSSDDYKSLLYKSYAKLSSKNVGAFVIVSGEMKEATESIKLELLDSSKQTIYFDESTESVNIKRS